MAWLTEAAAAGASRVRAKMAEAVELAALAGTAAVDAALGTAALAGRFGDGDLLSIAGHQAAGPRTGRRPSPTRRTPPSPAPRPGPGSAPRGDRPDRPRRRSTRPPGQPAELTSMLTDVDEFLRSPRDRAAAGGVLPGPARQHVPGYDASLLIDWPASPCSLLLRAAAAARRAAAS